MKIDIKVGYQGMTGAYSYIASRFLFPRAQWLGKGSFDEVYELLVKGKIDVAVLPIENTVIGSIFEVYDLLFEHEEVAVVDELSLRVDHNLLGVKGSSIESMNQVYSHPKALGQCKKLFLDNPGLSPVVWEDTAAAAAYVGLKNDVSVGAITSLTAAKEFGLEVVKTKVQSNGENYTRFVVLRQQKSNFQLSNNSVISYGHDKELFRTSLVFAAAHKPGSLLACLQPFARHGVNLTKIESRPLVGKPWQYLFYLDFEHSADVKVEFEEIMAEIRPHTQVLRQLGTYPKGITIGERLENNEVVIKQVGII